MSKKRKRRPRKPPKGNYHARGERRPLNLAGQVTVADEIERLRRRAKKAGVPELLDPDEAAFTTMPIGNVVAARQVVGAIKLGATPFIDPTSVFDLAHLAMAVHFGVDLSGEAYVPDGEQLEWIRNLCDRCGLDLETTGDSMVFTPSMSALEQYTRVSVLAVRRIALIQS